MLHHLCLVSSKSQSLKADRHRAKKDDVKKEKNRKKKGDDDYVSAIAKSLAQDVDDTISTMKMPRKKIESCEKIQSLS